MHIQNCHTGICICFSFMFASIYIHQIPLNLIIVALVFDIVFTEKCAE